MKNCSIECGVHTLELYLGQLSYADVDAMIEDLYDLAKKQKTRVDSPKGKTSLLPQTVL